MKIVGRNYTPDVEMLERIVTKLNGKFDPHDVFHHSSADAEMFEGEYNVTSDDKESWCIKFMGNVIFYGGICGAFYSDCQDDEYVTLEPKNEQKIFMLAVSGTIDYIKNFMTLVSFMDVSEKNMTEWIDILKKGLDNEN